MLVLLSLITAVASAFLDNVTTVVIMVPITLSLTRSLDLPLFPFLMAEIFAFNIGGSATIVGDPPNIIVASAGDIGFVEFLINIVPVSAASMVLLIILLFIWFRHDVRASDDRRQEVLKMSPSDAIRDKGLLWKSIGVFALTTVGFLVHGLLDVSPAFIALAGAGLLLLISGLEPREVLRGVEWSTLTFFAGLFVMVGGLVETGITGQLQRWMVEFAGGSERNLAFILVWFGGGVSSIVDNIPYTATIAPVVKQLTEQSGDERTSPLWWALTLGADLGGNFTTVGASANVVVIGMAKAAGHSISFMQFLKYGAVVSIGTLALSAGYLWLRFYY
ncbi:MAG: ArsB/NhaD family transporter [Chloroflexi bacterium]|nr:ArsB/NhaD family transporter [Chloroflexota bacterium]